MYKILIKLFVTVFAIIIAASSTSDAQLKQGSIGIGAFFSGSSYAMAHYALAPGMDIGVGLGYAQESYTTDEDGAEDPDPISTLRFRGMFRYFFTKGKDVTPYFGGYLDYHSLPTFDAQTYEVSEFNLGFGVIFGGQVFLAKGFAVYGHAALGYDMNNESREDENENNEYSRTTTLISLSGSSVGAIFYF